ncbi:aminotransferase class I/II-fold pyridoxal phosphate-dependent enzyme [Streptomyces sp. NPDC047082]|uniref:aminotransferase class I/II-fold pyridoxal phosphate-dependent enzyme n=1 Tax=Streptomyces sp. NPDC047082 TaxID=3155259 RepID=UPI0033F816DA
MTGQLRERSDALMELLRKCREEGRADRIRGLGLYPYYPVFQGPSGQGKAVLDGAEVCMFGSVDFRGLSTHPQVVGAAQDAVALYGTAAAGRRLGAGNLELHEELEADLAAYFAYEAALVFPSAYLCNLGVVSCLAGSGDEILLDEAAHASLVDGARLAEASGAKVRWYRHNRPDDLARRLASATTSSILVATEGVFSDGILGRLPELVDVCEEYGATLLVDEAQGVGVLGRGRGAAHHFALQGRVPLMTLSFEMSLASQGGAVLADAETIDYLRHYSRPLLFAAGLSPAATAAAHTALRELRRHAPAVSEMVTATEHLGAALDALGYPVTPGDGPVLLVQFPNRDGALAAQRLLLDHGVYTDVAPPTAEDEWLMITCTDAHTPSILDAAIGVFAALRADLLPGGRQAA